MPALPAAGKEKPADGPEHEEGHEDREDFTYDREQNYGSADLGDEWPKPVAGTRDWLGGGMCPVDANPLIVACMDVFDSARGKRWTLLAICFHFCLRFLPPLSRAAAG